MMKTDQQIRDIAISEIHRRLDQGLRDEVALTRATQIIDGLFSLPVHRRADIKPELLSLLEAHYNFVEGEASRGRAFAAHPAIKRTVAKLRMVKPRSVNIKRGKIT
jgi:hypothetical protein